MSKLRTNVAFNLLQVYKSKFGDLKIHRKFTVPTTSDWPSEFHGLKLGDYVSKYRREIKKKISVDDDEIGKALEVYFPPTRTLVRYRQLLVAFQTYRKVHGDKRMTNKFVVPKNDNAWPLDIQGLNLGRAYNDIRTNGFYKALHSDLIALGFPLHSRKRSTQFERVYNALKTYKEINGHLRIPQTYKVDVSDERYPSEARGMSLGLALSSIRLGKSFKQQKSELLALGVSYDVKSFLERAGLDIISSSFLAYRHINKTGNVPRSFVVPVDPRFPERTWGCNLGEIVCNLKESKALNDAKLFNVRIKSRKVLDSHFEVILTALVFYKRLHGNLKMRSDFVIPDQSPAFPVHTWGFALGRRVIRIKNGAFEAHHHRLKDIGFDFTLRKPVFSVIREGLEAYKAIHGNLLVPTRFIIPSGDARYPEHTWGIKLGYHLSSMRAKETLTDHYDEIIAMGAKKTSIKSFSSYEMFMSAFLVFKKLYGYGDVPYSYRIPAEQEEYPEEVRGLALGPAVDRIRRFGRFAEHRKELEDLGLRYQKKRMTASSF